MQQNNKQTTSKPMVVSIISEGVDNGTGFFVTESSIATNIHCIAGATSVLANHSPTNTEYVVKGIVASDSNNDLVILKVEGQGIPFPICNSDLVEKGGTVKVIGCPFGTYRISEGKFHNLLNKGQWMLLTKDNGC